MDLAAQLVRLSLDDRVEALRRRGDVVEDLPVVGSLLVQPRVPAAAAQLVAAEVLRHGVDPAAEVEGLVHAVHRPERADEGLLGDVLRQHSIAECPVDEAVDGRDIAAMKLFEGVHLALAVGGDELGVSPLVGLQRQLDSSRAARPAASAISSSACLSRKSGGWESSPIWYTR